MNILVVDDDPDIRELVSFKLQQMGHLVMVEKDGADGLATARSENPDLVLIDVMMPKLSGIDVCQRLRSDPSTAKIPVILITARARDIDIERGLSAGANDYIVKPFSPRELAARIETILAQQSQTAT